MRTLPTPRNKTVVLVDDDKNQLLNFGLALENAGYKVVTITVGDDYHVSHFQNHLLTPKSLAKGELSNAIKGVLTKADMIVTDYNYTDTLTGVDFIEAMRRINGCSTTPIMIHSKTPQSLLGNLRNMQRANDAGVAPGHMYEKSLEALASRVDLLFASLQRART